MSYTTREIGGAKAKLVGAEFENMLHHPARRQGFALVRFPDGCKTVRRGRAIVNIRIATPFDFILTRKDLGVAFFDAKSCGENTFSHSQLKGHQVIALAELKTQGNPSGYLIYFRKIDFVAWFTVEKLLDLKPRESLRPEDGVCLGGLLSINLERLFEPR